MKKVILTVCLTLAIFAFLVPAANAGWYNCLVYKVVPYESGNVSVQLNPGANETRFGETSRGIITGGTEGANKMLATLLTAMVNGWEVSVLMDDTPSWDTPQTIKAVGLISQ